MPRPVFDIEQYELRGTLPEVYTEAQKKALNETLARVNGQVDWTAQLLGFNGPNYWGRPNPKSDGTYNWTGLVETMHEKRQMQVGTYGVFNKNLEYSEWPAPLNREHINASGDAAFHLFEQDDLTKISVLGQGEECDYMHEPAVFGGGSYVFDADLEVQGKELDVEQYLTIDKFIEHERTWTRVLVRSEAVGGTLEIRRQGSSAGFCPLEILHWHDISDWKAETTRDLFIGLWGNKGSAVSFDFSFDALDLHGLNESHSVVLTEGKYSLTPEELLEKAGLSTTFWTEINSEEFSFKVRGCSTPFPVLPVYINEPYAGFPWTPSYIEDGLEFMHCDSNCDYTIIGRQFLTKADDHDNGDYESFCDSDPNAYTDCVEQIIPITNFLDNGTFEDEIPAAELKDEGEYDRNPWRTLERFEFELIQKTDCANFDPPCLEWVFDMALDNGEMENSALLQTQFGILFDAGTLENPSTLDCELDNGDLETPLPRPGNREDSGEYDRRLNYFHPCYVPEIEVPEPLINAINSGGPWATLSEGEYDKYDYSDYREGSTSSDCVEDGQWAGWDDGEYDEQVEPNCDFAYDTLHDGEIYQVLYKAPEWTDCEIDNLGWGENIYGPDPDVYTGPQIIDMGEIPYDFAFACGEADGDVYPQAYNPIDCDCSTECCFIDQGEYGAFTEVACNKIDGEILDPVTGREPNSSVELCAEKCPEVTYCASDILYINLTDEVFGNMPRKMRPDLRNAFTPLRLWKDRVLTSINRVPNAELTDHNFLVADQNNGATPEDSYRHFVRLPLEYVRDGKEWNRAVSVCDNMSYFSTPSKLQGTIDPPRSLSPRLYAEGFENAKDYEVFYEEDFLVSSISADTTEVAPGFEDSGVFAEEDSSLPFIHAIVTDYEPLEHRIPDVKGEWKGSYYVLGVNAYRTGHVSQDLATYALIQLETQEYPTYDFSIIKKPNIQFPNESGVASMKNYVVSYAYFAADYSASDDPVFDLDKAQCWRESSLDCLETTADGEACQNREFQTQTQYILHPTT